MCRIIDLSPLSNRIRPSALLILICILFFHGCAVVRDSQVKHLPFPGYPEEKLERHEVSVPKGDDVIGRMAVVHLEKGDTIPDIARHFGLGTNAITAANPGVDIWVPRTGERILLPLSFILPDAVRKGIVINLAAMRLFLFRENGKAVSTYPLGVGSEERPTPMGQMYVARKVIRPTWYVPAKIAEDHRKKGDILPPMVPPGPDNPLGEYALYLSKPTYLIHGTNKPASIGLRATNGCIRLYPENIKKLYEKTPINTPAFIVYQPYLIGQRNGVIYMEAHAPFEDLGDGNLDTVYAKLKNIEKKTTGSIDWGKVKETLTEARGYPVPISTAHRAGGPWTPDIVEVNHPRKLYGKPEVPELKVGAWYVLVADERYEIDAVRLAAMVNHQGPQIPARVLPKSNGYRVIAGPFDNRSDAQNAIKRLKYDLEVEGSVIAPSMKK
jgi:L,D-transpeptidase ErfK/SrfK